MTAGAPMRSELAAFVELARWLRRAPVAALIEVASRLGYVARGLVYLSLGAIALLAALDLAPRAKSPAEAVAAWAVWPIGPALVVLIATGLVGFALWRGLQSLFDADGHGQGPMGLAVRAGQGLSGIVHIALALSLLDVADELDDVVEDGGHAAESTAAALLAIPHGDILLIGFGAIVLALGLANLGQALFQDFKKRLGCEGPACDWAVRLARFGYVGRTMAFAPLGFFLLEAGLDARAERARSLGETLQVLESQPFGSVILTLAALGLMAFGLFAFMEARFRRMRAPTLLAAPKPALGV